jgi:hypothetical protein
MKQNINSSALWNEGGKVALVLGGVSVLYALITSFISVKSGNISTNTVLVFINFVLWFLKLIGCIFLMQFFMKRLVIKYSGVDNKVTMHFGTIVSFLSALIVAGYSLLSLSLMSNSEIKSIIYSSIGDNAKLLDLNTQNAFENIINNLPVYSFFIMLIYCFLYGYILSLILSKRIPSNNLFLNEEEE